VWGGGKEELKTASSGYVQALLARTALFKEVGSANLFKYKDLSSTVGCKQSVKYRVTFRTEVL